MNRLKFYRADVGLSQYELSMASGGVARWRIQLAERGCLDLTHEEKRALCAVFEKSIEEVFPGITPDQPPPRYRRKKTEAGPTEQLSFPFTETPKK